MALNLIVAVLTTVLALWMTAADFAFPGTLLFQDSASIFVLGLYLSVLFLLLLVLAALPKRIVIVANLLVLARGAMGWPLSLVMDYSLACRIISLGLLILGLWHLACSVRRPLLEIHRRPWLDAKHSIVAVLLWIGIGIGSIPAILLGYVEAGKELVGDYVRVSWSGISLVERVFEKDGRRVHLVGMMHIGDGLFYQNLDRRMRTPPAQGRRLVLTEGVMDDRNILPEAFMSGQVYARISGALGLETQRQPSVPREQSGRRIAPQHFHGVSFENADIDVSQLDERSREVLVAILEMLDTENLAELLVAHPEGVSGYDLELLLRDGLLRQRNDVLMEHFADRAAGFTEVYIPWGAAHLPDIEQRLLELGYTRQDETVRPIVQFWK